MGRVLIKFKTGRTESVKCRDAERAAEIAGKRKNVTEFNYYGDNDRIPKPKKKPVQNDEMSLEQMEAIIARM